MVKWQIANGRGAIRMPERGTRSPWSLNATATASATATATATATAFTAATCCTFQAMSVSGWCSFNKFKCGQLAAAEQQSRCHLSGQRELVIDAKVAQEKMPPRLVISSNIFHLSVGYM